MARPFIGTGHFSYFAGNEERGARTLGNSDHINEKGHFLFGGWDTVELAGRFGTPLYVISEEMIRRIRKAPDRDTECLRIAGEIAAGLKSLAQGVHFVTTGWEHRLNAILDFAGLG